MADTITKSVAARVPMDTYIDIIRTAAELRMTVSDYLIMKLFQESKNEQLQQTLAEKDIAISQINSKLSEIKKEKDRLEREIAKSASLSKGTESKVKEQVAEITALTDENTSMKGVIADLRERNTSSNTSMNTSLEQLKIKLRESEASVISTRKDYNNVLDINTRLSLELNKANKQVKDLTAFMKAKDSSAKEVYKMLETYNKDNEGFFSGPPIGDTTMEKVKKMLDV